MTCFSHYFSYRYLWCLLVIAALTIGPVQAESELSEVMIDLHADVRVSSAEFRLSDVAEVHTTDRELLKKLNDLILGKSPRIGYLETLSRQQIRRRINSLSIGLPAITWDGAEKIQLRSLGHAIDFGEVAGLARDYLFRMLASETRRVAVDIRSPEQEVRVPYGTLRFEPRVNSHHPGRRMCVWMDIYVDDVFYRALPVWMEVKIVEPVLVARQNIESRTVISLEDFIVQEREVAGFSARNIRPESFGEPLLMISKIEKGDILLSDDTRAVPAVVRGRKVNIRVSEGRIVLRMQGIAIEDAEIGDRTRIRALNSDTIINVKVIGNRMVEVI